MVYRKEFDILLKDILKNPPVRFIVNCNNEAEGYYKRRTTKGGLRVV